MPFYLFFIFSIIWLACIGFLFESLLSSEKRRFLPKLFSIDVHNVHWPRIIFLSFFMFLGIFFGRVYEEILLIDSDFIHFFEVLSITFAKKQTIIALLVSPIIFYSVYGITKSVPDNVVAMLISFQNGFFWFEIFDNIYKSI